MKKYIATALTFLVCIVTKGQNNFGYGEGLIVRKQGDTLKCLVELVPAYYHKVRYKLNQTGPEMSVSANEIKNIKTPYHYFENIQYDEKEKLMSLTVEGRVNLYSYIILNEDPGPHAEGVFASSNDVPIIFYVVKKDNEYQEVKKRNYKTTLLHFLKDSQEMIEKINKNLYQFTDLEKILREYNDSKF